MVRCQEPGQCEQLVRQRVSSLIEGERTELRFVLANLGSSAATCVYPHMLPTDIYQ
jgi:hypothetical protein